MAEKFNILFLDFDGVMNSHRSFYKKFAEHHGVQWTDEDFDPMWFGQGYPENMAPGFMKKVDAAWEEAKLKPGYKMPEISMYKWPHEEDAIDALNKIVEENQAKVVVCSTWRRSRTIKQLQEILNKWGAKCEVIGITPYKNKLSYDATRGSEILTWLIENNQKVKGICILDDDAAYDINHIFEKWCVQDISGMTHGLRADHIPIAKDCFEVPINPLYDFEKFYPMSDLKKYRKKAKKND
jgi:hypothetical protein